MKWAIWWNLWVVIFRNTWQIVDWNMMCQGTWRVRESCSWHVCWNVSEKKSWPGKVKCECQGMLGLWYFVLKCVGRGRLCLHVLPNFTHDKACIAWHALMAYILTCNSSNCILFKIVDGIMSPLLFWLVLNIWLVYIFQSRTGVCAHQAPMLL